ncbi:nucleoporin NUP188-like [Corticium candelabrum]|uniref:nucleoporin NUP188-like n=1 Tax=Corticium candelabrum TaxID=121492 RepID=UPI002E2532DF|nr:nucleoporin NUP188-like [Corticium candelabrum]
MAGVKSFRSLWNVLEGRSSLRDSAQISDELASYSTLLLKGNGAYTENSAESASQFRGKEKIKSTTKQFVLKLSKFLGLEEERTLGLFKCYLMDEYRGSRNRLQTVIASQQHGNALMVKIMEYFFEERLTVYQCLKHILVYWQDPRHPYRDEYKEFIDSQLADEEQGFIEQLMSQYKTCYLRRAPTCETNGDAMTNRLSGRWAIQLLREQASLLEVLFLYYRDFQMPPETLTSIAKLFEGQLFGARQPNKYLFNSTANEIVEYIGSLQMLIIIEGLDIDWIFSSLQSNSLAEHHIIQSQQCCQELDGLLSGWGDLHLHGPMLLSWAVLRLLTGDSTSLKLYRNIGGRALQSGAIQQLLKTLRLKSLQRDSVLSLIAKSVVYGLVLVIVTAFEESSLGESAHVLVSVLTETLTANHLCASFWKIGVKTGLGAILESSQARFPFQFFQFLGLLTSLSTNMSGAYKVTEYLKTLSVFSQPFDESRPSDDIDVTDDEYIWQVTDPRVVCRSAMTTDLPSIVMPPGTLGSVATLETGHQMITWEFIYSGWHLFLLEMDALLRVVNLGSDSNSLPIVSRVTAIVRLLHQILKSDYSLSESLNPVFERVYMVLQKFSSSHNPPEKLIEVCLNCITAVADVRPRPVWLSLQQTGFFPHTTLLSISPGMDVSASNFGHVLSLKERPSGQYSVTVAALGLLASLVRGVRKPPTSDDDTCLAECPVDLVASVLFVVHEIFSSFHRWRYVDIKDRDVLGHMSLEIFQLALAHGKVKVEGHDSLAGLVTRALLYSEAGHALLNIIATGVDVIDSLVAPQTSESEERGTNFVLMIKKAFHVVIELLSSTGEEASVIEQALSSLMVDCPTVGATQYGNGGSVHIISVIASYIHHHRDPELPTLSTQLLKRLCVVSPMSVYGCLGSEEDGHSIRDGYVMRLDARTEDVGLKVSILEFLANAIETQPGLTELFLDLKPHASDGKMFDIGRNSCLGAVLSLVTIDVEMLPLELVCAAFGFLESLWKNRKDAALAAIRSRDHFWESVFRPLLTDLPSGQTSDDDFQVASHAFHIAALEVFYVTEGELDESLCDILKEFVQNNRFEYWAQKLELVDSSMMENVSSRCRLHLLLSWQMFVLVIVNSQPLAFGLSNTEMKASLLDCVLSTLHAQVSGVVSPYCIAACDELSSLYSCVLRNWIEAVVNPLITLGELVKILQCAQNQDQRMINAVEKSAFSSCVVLLKKLPTETDEEKCRTAVLLLQIVTLSLQQAAVIDTSKPLKDMVVHVFLIEKLVRYLPASILWMPTLNENNTLLLLIQVVDACMKNRTDVEFTDAVLHLFLSISIVPEVAGALTILGVHQSLCLSLQKDQASNNSSTSQLTLINNSHKPSWSQVWQMSLALITTLLQTLERDFLSSALDFVGVHQEQLALSLEAIQSNQSINSLVEAECTVALLAQLACFHREWRFSLPIVFDSLKKQVGWLCQACSSLLSRPQLLSHLVDLASEHFTSHSVDPIQHGKISTSQPGSAGKHVHFDRLTPHRHRGISLSSTSSSDGRSLTSPLFIKIQGKLLSVLAYCLTVMRYIAPDLVTVINDAAFDIDEHLPQLRLAFNAPAVENIEMPSFGSVLAVLNACVGILPKPHRTTTPTKSPSAGSAGSSSLPEPTQDRSLLMFVIENCLRLILTDAAIYLRNPGVDPRVKRLLKRELGSDLGSSLTAIARHFARRSTGSQQMAGKKSPGLDRSLVGGAVFSEDDNDQKFFYLANMFVGQLLR